MKLSVAVAVMVAGFSATGMNVIKNHDLSLTDGMGGMVGWSYRNTIDSMVSAKPSSNGVIRLTFSGLNPTYFEQHPCELMNGGRYRLSAEVRTSGLKGAKCRLLVWDCGWHRQWTSKYFPDDTAGEWRKMEWSGPMPTRDDPARYTVAIAGNGGSADGENVIEVRNFRLEPLDVATAAATKGLPEKFLSPLKRRIVPIDPLLAKVPADKAAFTFYWPGEPQCGVSACTLVGAMDGGEEKSAKLAENGRAALDFGRVARGMHGIALKVLDVDGKVLDSNEYQFTAGPRPPKGPEGRRLNNFATELLRKPLENGTEKFFRSEDGWVWISFGEANDGAQGFLDDFAFQTVGERDGAGRLEAFRQVKAGWHTLRVTGVERGELRVNAVKNLAMSIMPVRNGACDFTKGRYLFNFAFWRRYVLPAVNTMNGADHVIRNGDIDSINWYRARGRAIWGGVGIKFSSPDWLDPVGQWKCLSTGNWAKGYDVSVDESAIGAQRLQHVIFAENCWRMVGMRPNQRVNMYWGDATRNIYDDPKAHASELAAIANTGDGTGVTLPETYAPVMRTREETAEWIDLFERQTRAIAGIVPAAKAMTVFNVSPWIDLGHWSDYARPEGDSKAMWSYMLHEFATRPGFAENSGIAAGASSACEEELRRWLARLFRYYGVEGGTEDLAERYGFSWAPGIVKNCDFEEELAGWTASPAQAGGVRHDAIVRYGVKVQGRKKVPNGVGDYFAEFTASDAGPNRLSQKLTGLEPGKLYAMMFCAANRGNVEAFTAKVPPLAFRARLEGAEEIAGLRYCHHSRVDDKKTKKPVLYGWVPIYRYVFRAKSAEATLVFEDRGEDGSTVPAGTKQILNYIVFRPYYVERPGEENEIAELIKAIP